MFILLEHFYITHKLENFMINVVSLGQGPKIIAGIFQN